MRAFKRLAAMAAMAAMAGLSGCQSPEVGSDSAGNGIPPGHAGTGANEDGQACGEGQAMGRVYILVGYDASGMPVVSPERCHVNSGTTVTWRGPDKNQAGFEIVFKAASAARGGQGRIASVAGPDRSRASIVADNRAGSYAYSVRANGKELDPQIIIDPR